MHQHLFRHAQQEEGLWESSWDEVTMRLLLYSLYSVRVLFTPELLRLGLMGNVQSRRLLINAVSGFWQHKQTMTLASILLHKGCTYILAKVEVH